MTDTASPADDRFQVRDVNAEQALRDIGEVLKKQIPAGMGFTFFLFDYGKDGGMFYISTAQRDDMISSMQEFIAKEEKSGKLTNQQLRDIALWGVSHDTGLSSQFFAACVLGDVTEQNADHPLDPSDFGRCYRFSKLLTTTQLVAAFLEASKHSKHWAVIAAHWDELVQLFEEEKDQERAPKLYKRMKDLGL